MPTQVNFDLSQQIRELPSVNPREVDPTNIFQDVARLYLPGRIPLRPFAIA